MQEVSEIVRKAEASEQEQNLKKRLQLRVKGKGNSLSMRAKSTNNFLRPQNNLVAMSDTSPKKEEDKEMEQTQEIPFLKAGANINFSKFVQLIPIDELKFNELLDDISFIRDP